MFKTLAQSNVKVARRFFSTARTVINSPNAPAAIGPYSQAVAYNKMIFVSGQLPLDPNTKKFASDNDAAIQATQCLNNIKAILEAGNSSMDQILKTTILLADMADFQAVNVAYAKFFPANPPARATYAVKGLPMNALVEIECVAAQN